MNLTTKTDRQLLEHLVTTVSELKAGQQALETGQTKLEAGQARLSQQVGILETGQKSLETGQTKLETGQKSLETGQKKLEAGQTSLEAGQKRLETGQKSLNKKIDFVVVHADQKFAEIAATQMDHSTHLQHIDSAVQRIRNANTMLATRQDRFEKARG